MVSTYLFAEATPLTASNATRARTERIDFMRCLREGNAQQFTPEAVPVSKRPPRKYPRVSPDVTLGLRIECSQTASRKLRSSLRITRLLNARLKLSRASGSALSFARYA